MDSALNLSYTINHVFLPPKLPQKDDSSVVNDLELLKECEAALRSFQAHVSPEERWRWTNCAKLVSKMIELRLPSGDIRSGKLESSLESMGDRDVIALHVRGQNAGLIVRKLPDQVCFESFELSPTTKAVMETKGRLRRCFPSPAIAIDSERMADPFFREALAQLLRELDINTPEEAWPVVSKAQSKTTETRDTTHPRFITEMLTGILRGIGRPLDIIRIFKRTRDDVLWNNALQPWRRSPLWLLIRVALQTTLRTDGDHPHHWYKSFMIFFMSHILQRALLQSLPSDVLYIMCAKISRRALKLATAERPPWMVSVHKTVEATHQKLAERWSSIEHDPDPFGTQDGWGSSDLCFGLDTRQTSLKLRSYLPRITARAAILSDRSSFRVNGWSRITQCSSTFPQLESLPANDEADVRLSLFDLELWVQDWLNIWLTPNLNSEHTITLLADLIDYYARVAGSVYAKNPEDMSFMLLTCMDLWVALDNCATHHHPLLRNYHPGFPPSLFDPLLLPKKVQMERLARIEHYLKKRGDYSAHAFSLVLWDTNKNDSLAVRYYDNSAPHKILREKIEVEATAKRDQKKRELSEKSLEYKRLKRESNAMQCDKISERRGNHEIISHSSSCQKCNLSGEASKLQIEVHEWPLPSKTLEAKVAVFELDVPSGISSWRNTTYTLLVDAFSPPILVSFQQEKVYYFQDCSGLTDYTKSQPRRLQLASKAKPFVKAHYGCKKIPQATENNICVNNGLSYAMYDTTEKHWAKELLNRYDVSKICTLQLPSEHYNALQYALDGTSHTSNEVLARQSQCPMALTLHEYYAFATLRSGDRLQWRNIARELVARVLNFSLEEISMLVAQAAWQVGRRKEGPLCRESHLDLEEEDFGMTLLSVLEETLGAVEGNWQGAGALRTFVILAARLLSMSPFGTIHNACHLFLRRARKVALHWTREVNHLLNEDQDAEELRRLNLRALEMALTCHSTFNVDDQHVSTLLTTSEDIAVVVECSIVIHDRCPTLLDLLSKTMKTMLLRSRRLSHFLEPVIRKKILADRNGIDDTVRRVWDGYRPGSPWNTMERPNEGWLMSETSTEKEYSAMTVHYNILDGTFLVNGKPLTRLPRDFELHTTYRRLFGDVHFLMYGSDLIVRTRRAEQVYELLPLHLFQGDFPMSFVQDYAHWLDVDTGLVEWRLLKHAWRPSTENWQMPIDGYNAFILSQGARKLIDIHSPTANTISRVLSPLEQKTHIHMIFICETGVVEVGLPRLKLNFSLRDHGMLLESKEFRGMVVDERQSFGALTGLMNKLVLREAGGPSRSVVIPHGNVSFLPDGFHVRIMIDTTSATHVKYHSYQIDNRLGRLVDSGSLQDRLFRIYLHATTAHCLVDQLTGRTGTEEALYGLAAAATRSFIELEPADIELLENIAQLTPQRQYYPSHLKVMQQVGWKTLSPLSQHCAFYANVTTIFNQAKQFQVFQENPNQVITLDTRRDQDLLTRASIRDSFFQVHRFGAESHTGHYDTNYASRDQPGSIRESKTHHTAKLVDDWSESLTGCSGLLSEIEAWGKPILGSCHAKNFKMGFDLEWLDVPSDFLPDHWCSLTGTLSNTVAERDKYKVMVFLSTLSYSRHAKQELVMTLLAFATTPGLRILQSPDFPKFQLVDGYKPVQQELARKIGAHALPFHQCPEYHLPALHGEKKRVADARRLREYERAKKEGIGLFVNELTAQWPRVNISAPTDPRHKTYVSVKEATQTARICFRSWNCNTKFQAYVQQAQLILDDLPSHPECLQRYSFSLPLDDYIFSRAHIDFEHLTTKPAPCTSLPEPRDFDKWVLREKKANPDHKKLRDLLNGIASQCSSGHEQRYVEDLLKSFEALGESFSVKLKRPDGSTSILVANAAIAQQKVVDTYQMICCHLRAGLCDLAQSTQMLPRLSPTFILSHLASDKIVCLPNDWKEALVQYGLYIATLQRAERLVASAENTAELLSEIENLGHRDWDPMSYPEWLLLEIENNILIRPVQAHIAREMMSPSSGQNSVMQLNMGLGKSSVIVPITAASLADRTQLVRVVVLKSLATQMFHSLAEKLGGMLNRRIFYMPITRSLKLGVAEAHQIKELYNECMSVGGILVVQPEHILSFELMGFDRILSGDSKLGNSMIRTQDWLRLNSRDILDESDEILSVRFELIYTVGVQRSIDFSPDRWAIIQHVLGLIGHSVQQVLDQFPLGLEVIAGQPGGHPRIRILENLAGDKLFETTARQICESGVPGVPVWNLPKRARTALFELITKPMSTTAAEKTLNERVTESVSMKNGVLLLKGLFAGGILRFALEQKRWRVNYGLDPSRSMLAVPYHGKDSPAARAEFSHPDTTLVFTCLTYYYGGLSGQQIRASFEALRLFDDTQEEYGRWVKDAPELALTFRQISGVNLSNIEQCYREIFPPLQFARGLINFYLSNVVFPAEMKEFPHKLSASGWDIAREKLHPTTGFSGTNDSRYILPLSIRQCDLPSQLATNAAVLDCLLRPENSVADICQASDAGILDAEVLLKMALDLRPPVRVILDVGAQVLELRNEDMARTWLLRVPESEAQAAIFFDGQNDICVLSRDGTKELLRISPFAKQMDQCLVYLDECHTRGTDLKLPTDYRAIVTLGPDLTKDRLVQACMRMRKLGKGQSVVLCGSMEIQRKILRCCGKSGAGVRIEVADVLRWCTAGTCTFSKKSINLWATQGLRHQIRRAICSESLTATDMEIPKHLAESLLEIEAQSLQERYGSEETKREEQILLHNVTKKSLLLRQTQLNQIRAKCREFEITSFRTAALQEEQERELSPENEREQLVELPPALSPFRSSIHPDVRHLTFHGVLRRSSSAFQAAFKTLSETSAVHYLEEDAWPEDLLVTTDFAKTIQASNGYPLDRFLRPVQWIVSCRNGGTVDCVVLSPYEVQVLLPIIRQRNKVTLHVYSPRLSATARTLEDLSFCTIPSIPVSYPGPNMVRCLNLFAGQLYLRSFEDYVLLCEFLGLCSSPPDDHIRVSCDGFIDAAGRAVSADAISACSFTASPVAFLRTIIALRRKGQSFTFSHLGRILDGERITREQF
ncbi:MAG: hypothetical protein M1818_004044 [Claussenomyces sp. TS43310]|nr:MAG: hypothetical protein M1818_004044 [Claussenomyces sp. TS43310]